MAPEHDESSSNFRENMQKLASVPLKEKDFVILPHEITSCDRALHYVKKRQLDGALYETQKRDVYRAALLNFIYQNPR